VNGILTLQTGIPFSVTAGVDRSLSGVGLDRADVVGPVATFNDLRMARKSRNTSLRLHLPNRLWGLSAQAAGTSLPDLVSRTSTPVCSKNSV